GRLQFGQARLDLLLLQVVIGRQAPERPCVHPAVGLAAVNVPPHAQEQRQGLARQRQVEELDLRGYEAPAAASVGQLMLAAIAHRFVLLWRRDGERGENVWRSDST